jgi:hypothetical protein
VIAIVTRRTYYIRLFYAAAIFNWLAAATVIAKAVSPSLIAIDSPFDPFSAQVFALFVAVFGYGYFLVSRDPGRNEGIVWMGIVGKLLTFLLFLGNAVAGNFPPVLLIPAAGDVLFAFLFLEFLLVGRARLSLA